MHCWIFLVYFLSTVELIRLISYDGTEEWAMYQLNYQYLKIINLFLVEVTQLIIRWVNNFTQLINDL